MVCSSLSSFSSRFISTVVVFLTTNLFLASHVTGIVYEITCSNAGGDTEAFKTAFSNSQPGDVILLAPCVYNFDSDYDIGDSQPDGDTFNEIEEGIIIRGTGDNPEDTVLKAVMHMISINLLVENLKLTAKETTKGWKNVVYDDYDLSTVFRDCIIESYDGDLTSAYFATPIFPLAREISLINTRLINRNLHFSTSDAVAGIRVESSDENRLTLMNSAIEGFTTGLDAQSWNSNPNYDDLYSIQAWNSDLTTNTYECCTEFSSTTGTCVENCPFDLQVPNTAVGNNVWVYSIDNLMANKPYYTENLPSTVLPVKIKFGKVLTAGQTTVYRLPSAYPALPSTSSPGTGMAQYYQFDSTARLKKQKRAKVRFTKTKIDENFNDPLTLKVYFWRNIVSDWSPNPLPLKIITKPNGKQFYQVKMPKRNKLNIMIAFAEDFVETPL